MADVRKNPDTEDGIAPEAPLGQTTALRVLVVDDNEDGRESLGLFLRLRGHDVRVAADGIEAVEAALEFRPDMILLDLGLPRLDGYEAARRIREQNPDPPLIVALTGWGQDEYRQKSKEVGIDHHLVKPLDFRRLEQILLQRAPAPSKSGA